MFKMEVKTKKGTREIKKDFVSTREARKLIKFLADGEKGNMDELEAMDTLIELVVDLFDDKKLEDDLLDNYKYEDTVDFCMTAIILATGGSLDEVDNNSPSSE